MLNKLYALRSVYRYKDLGARKILSQYTGLDYQFCERVGIAHGVDFGHQIQAQDVNLPLPIHWAFNDLTIQRAQVVKTCFNMAHPWLLLQHFPKPRKGRALVVGPPPGPVNDRSVYEALKSAGFSKFDILVKKRGNALESEQFWKKKGINVLSAGSADTEFYQRLASILWNYETIIGSYLSSALVFAGSIGLKVRILPVTLQWYEPIDAAEVFTYGGLVQKFGKLAARRSDRELANFSLQLLGDHLRQPRSVARASLIHANRIAKEKPVHISRELSCHKFRLLAGVLSARNGFLQKEFRDLNPLTRYIRKSNYVLKITLDEWDIAINGRNNHNFKTLPERYVEGENDPGMGR